MMKPPIGTGKNLPYFLPPTEPQARSKTTSSGRLPCPRIFVVFFSPSRKPLPSESFEFINHPTIRRCIIYTVTESWPELQTDRTQLQKGVQGTEWLNNEEDGDMSLEAAVVGYFKNPLADLKAITKDPSTVARILTKLTPRALQLGIYRTRCAR
jgi:hypothetical protein